MLFPGPVLSVSLLCQHGSTTHLWCFDGQNIVHIKKLTVKKGMSSASGTLDSLTVYVWGFYYSVHKYWYNEKPGKC